MKGSTKIILRVVVAAVIIVAVASLVAYFLTREDANLSVHHSYQNISASNAQVDFNKYINTTASTPSSKNYMLELNTAKEFTNVYAVYSAERLVLEGYGRNLAFANNVDSDKADALISKFKNFENKLAEAAKTARIFKANANAIYAPDYIASPAQIDDVFNQYLNVTTQIYEVAVVLGQVNDLLISFVTSYVYSGEAKGDLETSLFIAMHAQVKPLLISLSTNKSGNIVHVQDLGKIVDKYNSEKANGFVNGINLAHSAYAFVKNFKTMNSEVKLAMFESENKSSFAGTYPEAERPAIYSVVGYLF